MNNMQTVSIKLECTIKAAEIIFNALKQARLIAHNEEQQWVCMFVDGKSDFKIGDISVLPSNDSDLEIDGLLSQNLCWQSQATFKYVLDGCEYNHFESSVSMVDSGQETKHV